MITYLQEGFKEFPPVSGAGKDGLLAFGGTLSGKVLIKAYSHGIFPWYEEGTPVLWWSPDPRIILLPAEIKISKSLRQTIKKKKFEIHFDHDFQKVIYHCSSVSRKGQDGTWITSEMTAAYLELYNSGYAHSVEAYSDGHLAGGLYGVSLGRVFFGESMFFLERDASKVAFCHLVEKLQSWKFHFIDAQVYTDHLTRFGAKPVSRNRFIKMLKIALSEPTIKGKW